MDDFYKLLLKQLDNMFFIDDTEKSLILSQKELINSRFIKTCSKIKSPYYKKENIFPYHSCQYAMFLYFCANTIYKNISDSRLICSKIYNLLKIVSGMDLYYEVELPEIFYFDHPTGAVIGRGKFSNYFMFLQGCTVGGNNCIYPTFGEYVYMMSNSKVIGNSHIGNNVLISANAYVKDTDVPDNSIVFGQDKNLVIKSVSEEFIKSKFNF